ncbi:MAG TPA: GDSL-type esterase/lipase family protein [Thermoanaerobaculia bacterium]
MHSRRFFFWILPFTASLIAVLLFGYGFVSYLRGETGTPVDFLPSPGTEASAPASEAVAAIILGDSLARGTGDPTGLGIAGRLDAELGRRGIGSARRTYNFAVSGARTPDLLSLLDRENIRTMMRESNVIIVSIGGNDLWGGSGWRDEAPPDPDSVMNEVMSEIEKTLQEIRETSPKSRIFFIGLYNPFVSTPMGGEMTAAVSRWNSRLLEQFGDDPDFTLVHTSDLFSHRDRLALDRFHPSGEGYELIARRIADGL